jgi:hypothetical protein
MTFGAQWRHTKSCAENHNRRKKSPDIPVVFGDIDVYPDAK